MSKNKKKKNQKRMSPEAVDRLKTGFATILSNDACIKAGREMKGPLDLIPITIALASVVLAVLPTFTSRINVQGSAVVFNGASANYEQGVSDLLHTLVYDENGAERGTALTLKIEGGTFSLTTQDRDTLLGGPDRWYTVNRASTEAPMFEVYFNQSSFSDDKFFQYIDEYKNPFTGESRGTESDKAFKCSYLVFGKEWIRFRKRNDTVATAALSGRYDRLEGRNFTQFALSLKEKGLDYTSIKYQEEVRNYMIDLINLSYETDKIAGTWQYTGIFAGIDLGLIILFGAITFLMTRGKKNPFRIYTFWETQKMAYWASFTPALLAMILGFWLTQYAFIFFMFAYGMRMMWMSMRSLRPIQQ